MGLGDVGKVVTEEFGRVVMLVKKNKASFISFQRFLSSFCNIRSQPSRFLMLIGETVKGRDKSEVELQEKCGKMG